MPRGTPHFPAAALAAASRSTIVEELHERLDLNAMRNAQADALEANDLGIATLLLAQPLVVQPYAANREMGSMVLVDPGSNRTVGAVMVTEVLAEG